MKVREREGGWGVYLDETGFLRDLLEVVANVVTVAGTGAVLREAEDEHGVC